MDLAEIVTAIRGYKREELDGWHKSAFIAWRLESAMGGKPVQFDAFCKSNGLPIELDKDYSRAKGKTSRDEALELAEKIRKAHQGQP